MNHIEANILNLEIGDVVVLNDKGKKEYSKLIPKGVKEMKVGMLVSSSGSKDVFVQWDSRRFKSKKDINGVWVDATPDNSFLNYHDE